MLYSPCPSRFQEEEVCAVSNLVYSDILVSPYAESCDIELNTDCELVFIRHAVDEIAEIFNKIVNYPLKAIASITTYYNIYGKDSDIPREDGTFDFSALWLLYSLYCIHDCMERRLYIEPFHYEAIERFRFSRTDVKSFISTVLESSQQDKSYTILLTPGNIDTDQFKVLYSLAVICHVAYGWRVLFYIESDEIEEKILTNQIPVDCDVILPFSIGNKNLILNWEFAYGNGGVGGC